MKVSLEMIVKLCILHTIWVKVASTASPTKKYLPTVLWHGRGDFDPTSDVIGPSTKRFRRLIKMRLPGIYVYKIMTDSNIYKDLLEGYFGNMNDEVANVCKKISNNTLLQGGFNGLGLSQGAIFLRALIERCPAAKVRNYISLGGQHQGVTKTFACTYNIGPINEICKVASKFLSYGAYKWPIQNNIVGAQIWHDPLNEDLYRNRSIFLADINNVNTINEDYKQNLLKLSNMVLVKFLNDTVVTPIESEWFGFFAPGQNTEVLTLQETPLYKEDRLGLKALDEAGKLKLVSVEGEHVVVSDEWFWENIVDPYFATVDN